MKLALKKHSNNCENYCGFIYILDDACVLFCKILQILICVYHEKMNIIIAKRAYVYTLHTY